MALVLLAVLRHKPMHGYELLAELERLLPGYRASPGSVYPALTALVEERLLDAIDDERHARRRSFKITSTGRRALQQRASALAAFEVRTGARVSNVEPIEAALDRFRVRVMRVAERLDSGLVADELDKAASVLERAAGEGSTRKHG
jgi:DNA-binding PadR family transcriptional regulator